MTDLHIVVVNDGRILPALGHAVIKRLPEPVTHVVQGPHPWLKEPLEDTQPITVEDIPDHAIVLSPSTSPLVTSLLKRGVTCLGLDTALMPLRMETDKEIPEVPDTPVLEDPAIPPKESQKGAATRRRGAKKIAEKKAEVPVPVETPEVVDAPAPEPAPKAPETPSEGVEYHLRQALRLAVEKADAHVLVSILAVLEERGLL